MVSLKKKALLTNVSDFFDKYNNFSLISFQNTKHSKMEELRKSLLKDSNRLRVVKNSILEKALKRAATQNKIYHEFNKKALPTKDKVAVLGLSSDWSKGLNTFFQFIQKEKTLSFNVGLLDNNIYDPAEMLKIAQLPGKNQLIGQLIGSLKSPANKLVYSLKFNMNKLVYILGEKAKKG